MRVAVEQTKTLKNPRRLYVLLPQILLVVWLGVPSAYPAAHYQTLKSFGFLDLTAQNPSAPLIRGGDGALYGTTFNGGSSKRGAVFKVNEDGSGQAVLHHFLGASLDGQNPHGGLLLATNGWFYGTTSAGGGADVGTIFSLKQDGSSYTNLHHFGSPLGDGGIPMAGLIQASDGALYGTTSGGGSNGVGTVFRLNQDGSGYSIVYHFKATGSDGRSPQAGVLEARDGSLYGVTTAGGCNNVGIIFKLNKDGGGYTSLHHFRTSGADGRTPISTLVEGADAGLYGTTSNGGSNNLGTVFKLSMDGSSYTNLHHFTGSGGDGAAPQSGLLKGTDGALYGATSAGGSNNVGTVFTLNTDGSAYTVLSQFSTSSADGRNPQAGLLEASNGILFGTTYNGGTNNLGTVFKLQKNGSLYGVLVSFSNAGGDAAAPQGGVVIGTNSALYGTTRNGGIFGVGTIYKLNPDGSGYAVLHSFSGTNGDGSAPWGTLAMASDGLLYGTTHSGGSNAVGTVFRLNLNGTGYMVLYSFLGTGGDGSSPASGLIEGGDGALYGTTFYGGSTGNGTVFGCSKDLTSYTVVHSFTNGDGSSPEATVIQGSDGALYGTTYYGGSLSLGMIFKLNTNGTGYTNVHNFSAGGVDGAYPAAALLEGSDGFLYGTTSSGGTNGSGGTVFRVNKDGSGYALLHGFGGFDGSDPQAGLVEGIDGALYGTTYQGGSGNAGTIFTMNKDGTGYSVIRNLSGLDGRSPSARLVRQSNGVFYGTTYAGGGLNSGVVFQLLPPQTPDMISVALVSGTAQVSFSGVAGYQYSVLRSADLSTWTSVSTTTMPSVGLWTNSDNAPLPGAGFYRAAWVP